MSGARLKVLHLLVTLPVGGAEDLVAAVVRGLNPERFLVQAATIGSPGVVGEELRQDGYPVFSLGLDLKRTPGWKLVAGVRRLLQEVRPHILHTHLYHANLYGRLSALGLGLTGVVAEVHNAYTRVKLHRRLWNFLLGRRTDRLLVSSPQVWEDVRRYDGVPASRLLIIPYGIRLQELEAPLSREEAKAGLGVSGFCLGTVGRLEEQKGQRYLLAALPELLQEIKDLVVLIVGEGRLAEVLKSQARELGVAERVRFLGTRRDLPLIYRALDIFVLPSLWEGLPLALLKAMGAGLPVVATEVSGSRDVIEDGVNGRLVPPGASRALADAVLDLYRRPQLRQDLGSAAHEDIVEHYSLEAMLARLEALYLELGEKRQSK
ncbi:MAG: glycosyltransferase [Thermodesulfobacteriota bacterium]